MNESWRIIGNFCEDIQISSLWSSNGCMWFLVAASISWLKFLATDALSTFSAIFEKGFCKLCTPICSVYTSIISCLLDSLNNPTRRRNNRNPLLLNLLQKESNQIWISAIYLIYIMSTVKSSFHTSAAYFTTVAEVHSSYGSWTTVVPTASRFSNSKGGEKLTLARFEMFMGKKFRNTQVDDRKPQKSKNN